MTIQTNSRKIIHQGRVFKLYAEIVQLEDGLSTTFDVIRHPGAAAIVPLLSDHQVILLKQYRHAIGDYLWEIPAGTLSPNENPADCARRELMEETGFACGNLAKLTEITPLPGYSDERLTVFLASDLTPCEQHLDPDEILSVHTLSIDQAVAMIYDGTIVDAKSIIGLQFAFRSLNEI